MNILPQLHTKKEAIAAKRRNIGSKIDEYYPTLWLV